MAASIGVFGKYLPSAAMLDGDYLGAVTPFDLHDPQRVERLYQAMALLARFHKDHGVQDLVINYVFETPAALARLKDLLAPLNDDIRAVRLVCGDEAEMERRIRRRAAAETGHDLAWELARFRQLSAVQDAAALQGDLGQVIECCHKSLQELGDEILG